MTATILVAIAEFTTDLQYVAGKSTFVANALSREGAAAAKVISDRVDFYLDRKTIAAAFVSVSDAHQQATGPRASTVPLQQHKV